MYEWFWVHFGFFVAYNHPKPQIFLAHAFGTRDSLFYLFGWESTQKEGIREPVRFTLVRFGDLYPF